MILPQDANLSWMEFSERTALADVCFVPKADIRGLNVLP